MRKPSTKRLRSAELSRVAGLLRCAQRLKLRPDHLDEVIRCLAHELGGCSEAKAFTHPTLRCDAVTHAERRASAINHAGLRAQIGFLLCHETAPAARQLLREIAAGCAKRRGSGK